MSRIAGSSQGDPPAVRAVGSGTADGVAVDDIRYGAPPDEVEAWVVRPEPAGTVAGPGLVMWHWLDTEAPDGNRDEFRDEARALADRGIVSLLPQGQFPWRRDPTGSAADAAAVEAEVARLRRGLDLLAARPDVDPERLAVVGHDFGGMLAVVAAAEDPRIRAVALIAPTPRWGDWFLPFWPIAEDRIDYLRAMRRLDPVERIGALAGRPILLQLGQRDFYVPLMAGFELRRAAGGPDALELKTYDAEHDMRLPAARADRLAFLERVLGLTPAG
ncbi:MAG TPA: alpha/beta fold hydrolase [Candidatus Limnocylindrales bacterium]|jgi:dienelactone hydrolase